MWPIIPVPDHDLGPGGLPPEPEELVPRCVHIDCFNGW
jgi:hypothetical protein